MLADEPEAAKRFGAARGVFSALADFDAAGREAADLLMAPVAREKFDYTLWQREHYDTMEPGAFHRNAVKHAKAHPYTGDAQRL